MASSEHEKGSGVDANDFLAKITSREIAQGLKEIKNTVFDMFDPKVIDWCRDKMKEHGIVPRVIQDSPPEEPKK